MVTPESEQSKTVWQKTKTNSKAGFDRLWKAADKLGAPVNRFSNKLGAEAFWPTSLDKEALKAARILRSFCKDGFYQEEQVKSEEGPKQKQRVLKKIPAEVIKNAKGLAIFTVMRTGLWVSGAGGSGILLARKDDGTWSPPSGILLHTAGLGFLVGVDIYDCVLVLNTKQAVEGFARWRCTLGGEMTATAGPVGMGGVADTEVHKRQYPIFTYLKSRGFYAGVQIDGTVIIERTDENERFYHERISAMDIVSGKARHPPNSGQLRGLNEVLRAAQGDPKAAEEFMPKGQSPADYEIVEDGHVFGVPDQEDPDPYGVLALEKEGISIKEAATKTRASQDEFEFNPRYSSPIYNYRQSLDQSSPKSPRESWRRSDLSLNKRTSQLSELERRSSTLNALDKRSPGLESESKVALPPLEKRGPPPALPPRPSSLQMGDNNDEGESHALPTPNNHTEQREPVFGEEIHDSPITAAAIALTGGAVYAGDEDDKPANVVQEVDEKEEAHAETEHLEKEHLEENQEDDKHDKEEDEEDTNSHSILNSSPSAEPLENLEKAHPDVEQIPEQGAPEHKEADVASSAASTPKEKSSRVPSPARSIGKESAHGSDLDSDDDLDDDEFDDAEEEAYFGEVQQVQTASTPQTITKASVVEVPKRGPPPLLPPRNPKRQGSSKDVNRESDTSAERTRSSSSMEDRPGEQESISPISSTDRVSGDHSQNNSKADESSHITLGAPTATEESKSKDDEAPDATTPATKKEPEVPRISLANIRADMDTDDDEDYDEEPRGRTTSREYYM